MSNKQISIEKLQECIDLITETGILLSVKKTDFYQGNGKNKRHGRFVLDGMEYKIMKKEQGYYLFLLFSNRYFIAGKIIKAEDFKFKNQICWTNIIDLPENFNNLENY